MATETHYDVIIDTNCYSGNFERNMCAFITGELGDGIVGDDLVHFFTESDVSEEIREEISENILPLEDPDEEGSEYCLPVSMVEDDSGRYNGIAIHFSEKPSKQLVEFMVKRASEYCKYVLETEDPATINYHYVDFKVLGYRVKKVTVTRTKTSYTDEDVEI